MSGAIGAFDRLWRAIERSAAAAGVSITRTSYSTRRWASATFEGARHRIMIAADPSEPFHAWAGALSEIDLTNLGGHLVADLVVSEARSMGPHDHITIDALTVEHA